MVLKMFQEIDEYIDGLDIEELKKEFYIDEHSYFDHHQNRTITLKFALCGVCYSSGSMSNSHYKYAKIEKYCNFIKDFIFHNITKNMPDPQGYSQQIPLDERKNVINRIVSKKLIKIIMGDVLYSATIINIRNHCDYLSLYSLFYQKVIIEDKPDEFLIPTPRMMGEFIHRFSTDEKKIQQQQEKIQELTDKVDNLTNIILDLKTKLEW